jgi:hypothetical protein
LTHFLDVTRVDTLCCQCVNVKKEALRAFKQTFDNIYLFIFSGGVLQVLVFVLCGLHGTFE